MWDMDDLELEREFSSFRFRLDQIAVGFVLTLLAADLSGFLGDEFVGRKASGVPAWDIPILSDIPFFGEVLFALQQRRHRQLAVRSRQGRMG